MLGHCRLPRSCARTSASVMRAYPERRWPSGDRTRGTAATCRASGERLAPGMGRANETGHENHHHGEPTRTCIPAVPACPWGMVVPRLERAPATLVDAVRGTSVRTGQLHTAAAAAGLTALLVLHLGAFGLPEERALGAGVAGGGAPRGALPPGPAPPPLQTRGPAVGI